MGKTPAGWNSGLVVGFKMLGTHVCENPPQCGAVGFLPQAIAGYLLNNNNIGVCSI